MIRKARLSCQSILVQQTLMTVRASMVVFVLVAASCSNSTERAAPVSEETGSTTTTSGEAEVTTTEAAAEPEPETAVELEATTEFSPLKSGLYQSDHLPVSITLRTTSEFNVRAAEPGKIEIVALDTGDDYFGVVMFELDTLVLSDANGYQTERFPATADLSSFLDQLEVSDVTDQGEGMIGGREGRWWTISWSGEPTCCWETLFRVPGWRNLWGNPQGFTQTIWTVETEAGLVAIAIEAPTGESDRWAAEVGEHILAGLAFGEPTDTGALGAPAQAFGEYEVGQLETALVDSTRSIEEVTSDDGRVLVPTSDDRRLLISATYPADSSGHGAAIAQGPFPIVVSAHARFDAGITLPAEHVLASHGYVVVTVRFPESSFPGRSTAGIPNQPADVSFVLDEVLGGALGPELTDQIDPDAVGLVGASAGGTTVLGLTVSDCCTDDRVDAAVAHAATPFNFDSGERSLPVGVSSTPLLQIGSRADTVAPISSIEDLDTSWNADSYLATLQFDSHLGWLDPTSQSFTGSIDLVIGYFDRYLRNEEVDLDSVASAGPFIEFEATTR